MEKTRGTDNWVVLIEPKWNVKEVETVKGEETELY